MPVEEKSIGTLALLARRAIDAGVMSTLMGGVLYAVAESYVSRIDTMAAEILKVATDLGQIRGDLAHMRECARLEIYRSTTWCR
jgi:hypothetical protein